MALKKYLSIEQVAERFGLNLTTVYRLAQRGALPGFKVGSQWRFCEEMLEAWVADQVTVGWFLAGDQKPTRGATEALLGPQGDTETLKTEKKGS